MDQKKAELEQKLEYTQPKVVDYGDLQELTATNRTNPLSDVPIGQPGQLGFSI